MEIRERCGEVAGLNETAVIIVVCCAMAVLMEGVDLRENSMR